MNNNKEKTPIEATLMYFGILAVIVSILIFFIGEFSKEPGILVFGMAIFIIGLLLILFSIVLSNTSE